MRQACTTWIQDRSQLRAGPRTSQCVADSFGAEIWSHAGAKYRQRFYVSWGESFHSTHFSTFTRTYWVSDIHRWRKHRDVLNIHNTQDIKSISRADNAAHVCCLPAEITHIYICKCVYACFARTYSKQGDLDVLIKSPDVIDWMYVEVAWELSFTQASP